MQVALDEIAAKALALTTEKGFHENERRLESRLKDSPESLKELYYLENARRLALIHGEVSEALEADRKDRHADLRAFQADGDFAKHVKDTFEDELADIVIRTVELAAVNGIDLSAHVAAKMDYNKTRPYKFGKNY